ncbi:four helix bundle protein [Lachnospiraceae bacterium MD308]|nr:four helix bundle protein [Lachnospiraceae bacterium MD308]
MKKREESELLVIVKAKDLGNYIFTVTDKSPKKFRFSLISRLQNLALSMIENLYRANMVFVKDSKAIDKIEVRKKYQREAYVDLKLLGYMALMAKEQGGILAKQYEQISIRSTEVIRLLLAWSRSDQNRYKG